MLIFRTIFLVLLLVVAFVPLVVFAQDLSLPPKNGLLPKNEAQKSVDWVVMVHDFNFAKNDTTKEMNLQPKYGSLPNANS